jgi:hypothetical protein
MSALEIVKTDRSERSRSAGPSWNSLGLFTAAFLAVVALAFMLGLGFLVLDTREELRQLRNEFKAQTYVINELAKDYAVLDDRTKEK